MKYLLANVTKNGKLTFFICRFQKLLSQAMAASPITHRLNYFCLHIVAMVTFQGSGFNRWVQLAILKGSF